MRIQIPVSSGLGGGGGTGPSASPSAFGAAIGAATKNLGKGVVDVGDGIAAFAKTRHRINERNRLREEQQWSSSRGLEYNRRLSEWMADPVNNTSPDYFQNYEDYSKTLRGELSEGAPTPEAFNDFSERAERSYTAKWGSVAGASAQNKFEDDVFEHEEAYYQNFDSNRSLAVENPEAAYSSMVQQYGDFVRDTDIVFDLAPEAGRKEKANMAKETIAHLSDMGMVDEAQDFLDNHAAGLSPEEREALNNKLEREAKVTVPAIQRGVFDDSRSKALMQAQKSGDYTPGPVEQYTAIYGEDRGVEIKRQDDQKAQSLVKAHEFLASIASLSPQAKLEAVEEYEATIDNPLDQAAFQQIIYSKVQSNLREYNEDPVSWLQSNNPEIRHHINRQAAVENAPSDPEERAFIQEVRGVSPEEADQLIQQRNNEFKTKTVEAILRYQGRAPEGDPSPELYLNLPPHQQHILTKTQANNMAEAINKAPPQEVVGLINNVLQNYPDENHKFMVFKDLTELPNSPIRQEYQLLFQNREQWWVDSFVGSLQNNENLSKLSGVNKSKISATLDNNSDWLRFQQALVGDNMQRASDVAGFKKGIETYAASMIVQGATMDEAVGAAVDQLVKSTLGITKVETASGGSGLQMVVPRERGDGQPLRTDEEVDEIGRRASIAMGKIDPNDVDPKQFPTIPAGIDSTERRRAIHDTIMNQGFFQLSSDGQFGILYLRDPNRMPFPLRDTEGKTFKVRWDDLPEFWMMYQPPSSFGEIGGQAVEVKPDKRKEVRPAKETLQHIRRRIRRGGENKTSEAWIRE